MRKYLIQDITPPGKKHAVAHKAKAAHDEEKPHKKTAAHTAAHHATHKTTAHRTAHHAAKKAPAHEEEHAEEHEEMHEDLHEEVQGEVIAAPTVIDASKTPSTEATTTPSPVVVTPSATVSEPVTPVTSSAVEPAMTQAVSASTEKTEPPISAVDDALPSDPRSMLVDKIIEPVDESETKIFPHAPSYFNDAMDAELPAKAWHYSSNSKEDTHYTPPPPPVAQPQAPKAQLFSSPMSGASKPKATTRAWIPWVAGSIIIFGGAFLLLHFYSGVDVQVIQKHDTIPLDQKITAVKTPKDNELSFSVIVATSSVTKEVQASEEKVVTTKASGKIIIYNTQNVQQRLIKNTRFQSPTGKIYRINDSVNIPKATTKGGVDTPGSLEVTVYADEAGPDYNTEPTDFTVPGLKGSKIFDMVYGRSQGPITGGASGSSKSVSDDDMKQAAEDLRVQLETKLRSDVRSSVASWSTHVSYDTGVIVELGESKLQGVQASAPDKAVIAQEGTIYLITFDREELTRAIVKALIPTYKDEAVAINNLDSLSVDIPKMTGRELMEAEELPIVLKGNPSLEWTIDEAAIKTAILGISKSDFNGIMAQFPTVERAKASIRPVWKDTFPTEAADIKLEIVPSISE